MEITDAFIPNCKHHIAFMYSHGNITDVRISRLLHFHAKEISK